MAFPEWDSTSERWETALDGLTAADPADWAGILTGAAGMDGGSVSTMGDVLASETLSATTALAARIDELQFDLGEGPCWDALSTRRPVIERDLAGRGLRIWPTLSGSLLDDRISGLFAFPLLLGPLQLGAVDLYVQDGRGLSPPQIHRIQTAAGLLSRLVFRRAVGSDNGAADDRGAYSRRIIHQATGAVIAQVGLSSEDAYLLIQGKAFRDECSMHELAEKIIRGLVVFEITPNGIEEKE